MRVLFLRLRSLGDTVLMTPALEIAKKRSGCRVGVVSEPPFHHILEDNPNVDVILIARKSPRWWSRLQTLRQIRAFKPDLVVDLHGGTTSAFFCWLSGARQRVGYAASRHFFAYNVAVPPSIQVWGRNELHTVEHQLSPLRLLGFPVEPIPSPLVPVGAQETAEVRKLLSGMGVEPGFILIHPAAAFTTKQWPIERFVQISEQLEARGHPVVVTAGPGQEDLLRAFRDSTAVVAPLPLRSFAALASLCRLYVGNDTGTTHMAAALGKPVVVIFGSSDYRVWSPWNTRFKLLHANLPCIPCPGYRCLHYSEPRCVRSIEVEEVEQAILRFLS